jgi:hypothetical protein
MGTNVKPRASRVHTRKNKEVNSRLNRLLTIRIFGGLNLDG